MSEQVKQGVATVTPREVYQRMERGENAVLIDVRTPIEYAQVHAEGATLMPLNELDVAAVKAEAGPGGRVYVICKAGSRSKQAAERCAAEGLADVAVVEGGTEAWERASLPVVRTSRVISLERQVRIAAGTLVLLGVLLAAVNPWFLAISAFVGAGLIFAGVTDYCGMALLLAKMPWNKVDRGGHSGMRRAA